MQNLQSPWMYQLDRTRPLYALETDVDTDICIVGGGVSGIMTAYQVLKNTKHRVVLVEAQKVANGATGHNAGQLVDELERSTVSLVEEFGLDKTVEGLKSVKSAWIMLEEIMRDAELNVPCSTFEGFDVFSTKRQILEKLADIALAGEGGLVLKKMYISAGHAEQLNIPEQYRPYYELIPHESLLSLSQTINPIYIASYPLKKGCLNSAVLTEQLTVYLQNTYGVKRFQIFEETPVTNISLHKDDVRVHTSREKYITAKKIILCTNGFENFKITDLQAQINFDFHKNVKGNIGYMLGMTEDLDHTPSAFAYYDKTYDQNEIDLENQDVEIKRDIAYGPEYVYTTRRPYDLGHEKPKNLFCIGGKGMPLEDTSTYGKDHLYHPDVKKEYEQFIDKNFDPVQPEKNRQEFIWHGLMGYTADGLRMVGFEKKNNMLMYNLGCNGIGIMPAIWGAKRIADLLNGDKTESLFDPRI